MRLEGFSESLIVYYQADKKFGIQTLIGKKKLSINKTKRTTQIYAQSANIYKTLLPKYSLANSVKFLRVWLFCMLTIKKKH